MARRPSLQFYPADWRNDPALRMCSLAARGLWWEMICVMHTCEPYGHLVAAGKAIEPEELARIVGESAKDVRRWLAELERHCIFSRTPEGVIYSRRMVRDEIERDKWRDRQAKSRGITEPVTPKSPRSSSSLSSSSSEEESSLRSDKRPRRTASALPEGFPGADAVDLAVSFWTSKGRVDLCAAAEDEAAKFRDHHTAHGTRSCDWGASWRTWFRNAVNFNKRPPEQRQAHNPILKVA